jgi:GMP synthase (glutamine-hydrolysing)
LWWQELVILKPSVNYWTCFYRSFDDESHLIEDVKWLAQGTIYPDVIESCKGPSATIKSHHNVGGLPDYMKLKIVEPLRMLLKMKCVEWALV